LPPRLSGDVLQQMLRHMEIESMADTIERSAERISSLEDLFCVSETQSSMSLSQNDKSSSKHEEVNRAIGFLRQFAREDRIGAKRKRRQAAAGRWIRVQSLQSILDFHSTEITRTQTQLVPIIFARLSTEQKREYFRSITLLEHKGQVVSLSDRLELLQRLAWTQNVFSIPKVELELHESPGNPGTVASQPASIPKPVSIKPPLAAIRPQHSLIPTFPVRKDEFRTAAV